MRLSELHIGTRLELEIISNDGTSSGKKLVSEFEWAEGEQTIILAAPIIEGTVFPLRSGTMVNIYFAHRKEKNITFYSFKAVVTDRGMTGNLPVLKAKVNGTIEKVQRRDYYRLDCSISVRYRLVDSWHPASDEDEPFKKTLAINISGGGIRLLLEEKTVIGKLVECEIPIGEERTVRFFGKILALVPNETNGIYKYEAGIAYTKITENDREKVIRFIFEEQRKLRKKGLI